MKSVLHSFVYSLEYLKEQVSDIPAHLMVAQPKGIVNHPAWTMGHLVSIFQAIGGVAGIKEWLPPHWDKTFGMGSIPKEDSSSYPSKEELLMMINEGSQRILLQVESLNEARLDQPFPDEAFLDVFPTVRHALTQVLLGHTAFHIGQLSVWRRGMGLPALIRSYE